MDRIFKGIVIGSIAFVMMGCGGGDDAGAGGGIGAGGNGGGGAGTCQRQYTTADLAGCFQASNSAMRWYCFDGQGYYREIFWTAISGCAEVGNGTYEINGCTMKSCSEKEGCGTYPVGQDQAGNLMINGVTYTESDCH